MKSGKLFNTLVVLAMLLGMLSVPAVASPPAAPLADALDKVEPLVLEELTANGQTDFFAWMVEKADLSPAYALKTKAEKGQFVFETLRATAERTQADLRAYLDAQGAEYQPFYIANKVLVRGGHEALLLDVAARPDVARITANHKYQLQEPFKDRSAPESTQAIEPNITFVNADDVWALGVDGDGTVMAGNDTGLDEDHPAIAPHYRGCLNPPTCTLEDHNYNWWDATGTYPNDPWDGHGHGTHTTGTMVGDDGGANQIGMAPGAQTVHCKNMTDGGSGDDGTFTECFQWDLAPWKLDGSDPDPMKAPDAINNSWGYWGGGAPQFEDEIAALQAAGVAVEVSAGNEGSSCYTLRSPGDYSQVITTGSVNHAGGVLPGTLTGFSSRGPSYLYPGDTAIPDVMAPGENIRSSVPGGGYQGGWSGTSMSGPHVTALIGLIWSANPALRGQIDTTYQIIYDTAVRLVGQGGSNCGGDYVDGPNNDWGYGTIDAYQAVLLAIEMGGAGTLDGTVTDFDTGLPLEDVLITAEHEGGFVWDTNTNASGYYNMTVAAGTFDVTAELYGYLPQTVSGVVVYTDAVTTQDFELVPAEMYLVEGTVTDAATGWPLYARLEIGGYPGGPVWTDPETGYYSVSLAGGLIYEFNVSAWVAGYLPESRSVGPVMGNLVEDFALAADVVACNAPGYTPAYVFVDDFENGYGNWMMDGLWNPENEADVCGSQVAPFPSSSNDAYYGLDGVCTFNNGNTNSGSLTLLAPVVLPPTGGAVLSFWSFEETECGGDCYYDNRYVEISTDGGGTWITLGEGNVEGEWYQRMFDLTAFLGQSVLLRFRFDTVDSILNDYFGWMVDDVGIATGCVPTEGGLVVGNVYDLNTGVGLVGATVTSDLGDSTQTKATPDDPNLDDGFYTLFSTPGAHTFTASLSGYAPGTEPVDVPLYGAVGLDFYLGTGFLTFTPPSIEVTLDMGASTVVPANLENSGSGAAFFEMQEQDRGFQPAIHIPPSDGYFPQGGDPPSLERAPRVAGPANPTAPPFPLTAAPAFAVDVYPGYNLVTFDSETPNPWTVIAPLPGNQYFGGDFMGGDFAKLYVVDYGLNQLHTVDTATGAVTVIGPAVPAGGEAWTGLTGAPDGTLYGSGSTCASSTLYTVDPGTGTTTPIGPITNGPCIIDIAVNAAGEMYGVDIVNDVLLQIDPATGAGTVIGSIGFDANYAQGMDFEEESGVLYLAAYNNSMGQGELRICDTGTGNSILVGAFPNGAETDSLGFATGGAGDVPWLMEDPVSGTVPAGGNQPVDITFDAGVPEITQPGTYYATIRVTNDTPYGPIAVPVSMTVIPPATYGKLEGTVTGLGYCDLNPAALEEAEVVIQGNSGATWTLLTDENGYYQLWLDEAETPLAITVNYPVHETGLATGVVIVGGEVTTVDFDLRWLKPCLSAAPDSIQVTLEMGNTTVEPLTLTNDGAAMATFEILEQDRGFQPTLHIPPFEGVIEYDGTPVSIGRAPNVPQGVLNPAGLLNGAPAFAVDVYPGYNLVAFDSETPNPWTIIAPLPGNQYFAGDFVGGDFGTLYVIDYGLNQLHTVDTASGAVTVIGPSTPYGGESWTGMAGSPDGTMYASSTNIARSTLYTVDLGSGAVTVVGEITNAPAIIDIAVNAAGEMYGVDIVNDVLLQIDPATGAGTVIGSIGFNANYAQGMDFEEESGVLYLAAFNNNTFQGELRICDTGTGNSILVGAFPNGAEVDSMGFATGGVGDVPWLFEDPVSGTVPADGGTQVVDVTFDAGLVAQPGEYYATLKVKNDDPVNKNIGVPVSMTVTAPANWGKLEGTVTGLGYCDVNPAALEEAMVEVVGGLTVWTDEDGHYVVWLEEGTYDVNVTADGHTPGSATVVIVGGGTWVEDFDLRLIAPCISLDPLAMEVTVVEGTSEARTLQIINTGAGPSEFKIQEKATTLGAAGAAPAGAATNVAPSGYIPTLSQPAPGGPRPLDGTVAVFKDADPWGVTDVELFLAANSIPYEVHGSGEFGALNFDDYGMIVFSGDQPQSFYDAYASYVWKFEDYVEGGGFLNFFSCDSGWNGGSLTAPLPGGMTWTGWVYENYNVIDDPAHPVVVGVPNPFYGNYASHGHFTTLPGDAYVIAHEQIGGLPTIVEYPLGNGWFIAFGQPLEISHNWGWDAGLIMENTLLWGYAFVPGGDVPWLTEDPVMGTVPADSTFDVEVTFTALPTLPVGTYSATLVVKTDDAVNPKINVPVTMHIVPAGQLTMHVGGIKGHFVWGWQGDILKANVLAEDENGVPLPDTEVHASVWAPNWGPRAAVRLTNLNGKARFAWGSAASGLWKIHVDDLVRAGYVYNPGDNVITEKEWTH